MPLPCHSPLKSLNLVSAAADGKAIQTSIAIAIGIAKCLAKATDMTPPTEEFMAQSSILEVAR